ncbi:MAG: hypothetical protein H6733_17040 [Alphaproteobacteria bacterium]|nr:hypothetical protein [Alphaproteobacteria bacterium]
MRWFGLVVGAMVGCASGATPSDDTDTDTDVLPSGPDPLTFDVMEPGPWNVGFRDWEITYAPIPGRERTVRVSVWYPTEATAGPSVRYSGVVPGGPELGDAPPASPAWAAGFPVVAYSHGDQGYGATSAFLMRWFASHGWIAVAPDHTDNLLWATVDPPPSTHWYDRPLDVRHAIDSLGDRPTDDPLYGLVDAEHLLVTGHSRGTSTVWSLAGATHLPELQDAWCPGCSPEEVALFTDGALAEPRADAFLPLAGVIRTSVHGTTGQRSVTGPFLLMTGSNDHGFHQDEFDALDGVDLTWVDLDGGCHQTFALGTCATLPTDDGFAMVATYALAFARQHVLGDDDPMVTGIVDGSVVVDTRASLWHHDP